MSLGDSGTANYRVKRGCGSFFPEYHLTEMFTKFKTLFFCTARVAFLRTISAKTQPFYTAKNAACHNLQRLCSPIPR
jgi:hypothetical protein